MTHFSEYQLSGNISRLIRERLVPLGIVILILIGTAAVMASNLNIMAATVFVFGIVVLLTAVVAPKAGIYLLILAAGYLDLVKRLMVVTGQVSIYDVALILAVAPVLFIGVELGLIGRRIFQHKVFEPGEAVIFLPLFAMVALNVAIAFRDTKSIPETLKLCANSAAYIPLALIIGMLFPTPEKIGRFLARVCWIFLPVPLYALWQFHFGLADFEYDYLRTGLTITEGSLDDLRPRPFSTLASPHPLSVVCSILFLLCLVPVKFTRKGWFPFSNGTRLLLAFVFLAGSAASLARSGLMVAVFGLGAALTFWNRKLTKIFYAVSLSAFFLIVLNPDWIESHLGVLEAVMPSGSDEADMAFRLGTIGDRLHSWKNVFSHPAAFGPFGVPVSERGEDVYVHDQIGQVLVNFGYVGLTALLALLIFSIVKAHRLTWKVKDPEARKLAIFALSIVFGVIASGALFGGHTSVFPNNIFFWMSVGTLIQVFRWDAARTSEAEEAPPVPLAPLDSGGEPLAGFYPKPGI